MCIPLHQNCSGGFWVAPLFSCMGRGDIFHPSQTLWAKKDVPQISFILTLNSCPCFVLG